jgi:hypothetical protein
MSQLLNVGNSITAGSDPYQFYNFRERVLSDGATILSDTQVSEEIKRLRSLGLFSKFSALYTPAVRNTSKLYSIISADGDATVTRGSVKNIIDADGDLEQIASNVTPSSFGTGGWGALVEGARTNSIRNNTMAGAVVGTPGTLPTNWTEVLRGLVREVVAISTANGINYIDLRFSGTANTTATLQIRADGDTGALASVGQNWSFSTYFQILTQVNPPNSARLEIAEINNVGSFLRANAVDVHTPNIFERKTFTAILQDASVASTRSQFVFALTNGQSYDFTIRIGLPQMEQGAFASSVMKTSSATFTRPADVITKTGASDLIGQTSGWIYAVVDVRLLTSSVDRYLLFAYASSSSGNPNRLLIVFDSSNRLRIRIFNNLKSVELTPTDGIYKILGTWDGTNAMWVSNGVVQSDTITGSTATMDSIVIGSGGDIISDRFANDRILLVGIGKGTLTEAEAIALTT